MYICLCNGITETDLEQAAQRSKRKEDVLASLGLGQSCGVCLTEALDKLGLTQKSRDQQAISAKIEQKSTFSN